LSRGGRLSFAFWDDDGGSPHETQRGICWWRAIWVESGVVIRRILRTIITILVRSLNCSLLLLLLLLLWIAASDQGEAYHLYILIWIFFLYRCLLCLPFAMSLFGTHHCFVRVVQRFHSLLSWDI